MGQAKLPQVPIVAKFPSSTKNYQNIDDLPELAWWYNLKDPELNRLIACGLKNNLDMHIAVAHLEQAQGQLSEIKLGWLPSLEILGGYSTNPALGIPGFFFGAWPGYLINIAKLLKQQQYAKFNVQYNQAMIDGVRLSIIGQVTASYFTLIAEKEQLHLLNILAHDVDELVSLARGDIKIGLKNDIALADMLELAANVRAQKSLVINNITVSQNALRYFVNENPGTLKSANNFVAINFDKLKPGALPANVLANRPDLKMAEMAVRRSHAGVLISYTDLFPTLVLDQYIGEGSIPFNTFEQAGDSYVNWGIDPKAFGKIVAEKGAYKAQVYNYIKTVRSILREVDNDFSANRRASSFFIATAKAQSEYNRKYQLQKGLLQSGLISYKELLDSKVHLDSLALVTNQAKLQLALTLVSLYQNLAGGYKSTV